MKVEGWLFLGCGIFFGGTDVVYWYTSHDPAGTTALALSVGVAVLTRAPPAWHSQAGPGGRIADQADFRTTPRAGAVRLAVADEAHPCHASHIG